MEVSKSLADQELISNIQAGIRLDGAIRELYRGYFDMVRIYVVNNSGNQQDAEDIFQDVIVSFIDIIQKNKFRGESSLKTFFYSLSRHTWLNELKRRGRAQAREEKYERGKDTMEFDTSHFIADRERKQEVIRLVDELGEACKKILMMFYYENLSMKEILESMHYENEQVVRNKKYKCLKQLEQMINEHPELKQNLKSLLHG
ncbi:MAG TPA: sigma-70 family RNA polymerase sigma factor [Chitinophagaceae bacterium]|nr:sigma-70 family RNA polymerase sigma factor [Chitinophagaceae bacterium]